MNQTKEKAPATPASATSAENKYHIENTTENRKNQEYSVANYLEYYKLQGKEPNPDTVRALEQGLKVEPGCKTRQELDAELILRLAQMNKSQICATADAMEFIIFMDEKKRQGRDEYARERQ